MTSHKDDDPFSWDIDRVVQELCSSKRSWVPTPRMQFPDPAGLEAKLREGEYDGELLLSSLTNEADLWSDLGIIKSKFKQTLRTAIAQLRTRSPEYRKYERSLHYAPEDNLPFKKENHFLSPGLTDAATPASAAVDGPTREQSLSEASVQMYPAVAQNDLRHARIDDSGTSPKPKKRRLAASGLTNVDLPDRQTAIITAILTEADRFTSSQPSNLLDRLLSGPGAYWGEGRLTLEDLFAQDMKDIDDAREFGWVQSQHIGRAKAKWVNTKMKKFLREPPPLDHTDSDELPAYGESDEEDNPLWDVIEREREDEDEEVRQEKLRAQATCLHSDEIDVSIQEMIQELVSLWNETKLSILQRKAFKIWNQAQQSRTRNKLIIKLTQSLRHENERLQGKVKYLRDNSYSSKKELLGMKPTLEPTVFEIEKAKWTITVLQRSRAPDKPEKVSLPLAPRDNKKPKVYSDGGIDIWSEDELDDFIVKDDPHFQTTDDDASAHFADDELPVVTDRSDGAMDVNADAMDVDASQIQDPGQSFGSTSDGDIEMFDLTQVEEADGPIPLHTPMKSKSKTNATSPFSSAQDDGQIPYSDTEAIAEKGTEYWRNKGDHKRLLITLISHLSSQRRVKVLESAIYSDTPEELWQDQIEVAIMFNSGARDSEQSSDKIRRDVANSVARLFHVFCGDSRSLAVEQLLAAWQELLQTIAMRKLLHFEEFWKFLRFLAPYFNVKPINQDDLLLKSIAPEEEEDLTPHQKSTKARLQKSARIRLHEAHSSQAKEARRLEFRASAQVSGGTADKVINESKEAGQGLICVHPHIAYRIRPHQLEGVRFMWDEITKDTHKGCLLAHTMGLGKTMQTITLLSALAEAATSEDDTVSSQIPEHLKAMKVVILCPVNVLSNWVEELYNWTPPHLLGPFHKLDSTLRGYERSQVVEEWATEAGSSVLVVGYSFFISLTENVRQRIQDVCSIVIGDEAHFFKNRLSKTGMAVNSFKTTSRIALTGSPLSNNVKEYYSMIDWVAPGFLGDPGEFNMRYGNPIEFGLSVKSDRGASRKAKILLAALKKLVETKVHRMSMHVLKGGLPPKVEFIIYLDLSEIQMAAYNAYLKGDVRNRIEGKVIVNNVWALQAVLPLLLAHPSIYHRKLEKDRAKIAEDMKEMKAIIAEADQPEGGNPDKASPEAPLGIPSETVLDALKVFDEPAKYNAISASYKMLALDKILEESLKLGDNVLVFSQKLPVLDYIEEHLLQKKSRKSYRIDGSVNPHTRQAKVHSFNQSHGAVFLISTTAGGVGLNLHGANRVVIMDSQYNPTHEQQAVGRAYRIGQRKPVFVYWLLCDGTFEKTMQSKQIFKTQLSSRVVDDKAPIAKHDQDLLRWFYPPMLVPHQDTSRFQGRDAVLDAVLASDITTGISSMETTDTFEEEEEGEDKELSPNELEQANQMALGKISELTLPKLKNEVQQLPNFSPMPVVAQHSGVNSTSNPNHLIQQPPNLSPMPFGPQQSGVSSTSNPIPLIQQPSKVNPMPVVAQQSGVPVLAQHPGVNITSNPYQLIQQPPNFRPMSVAAQQPGVDRTSISLPLRQPPNSIPNSTPRPVIAQQSGSNNPSNPSPLVRQASHQSPAAGNTAAYKCPKIWARRLKAISAPSDLKVALSTYWRSIPYLDWVRSQANAHKQGPTGIAFTRPGSGTNPGRVGSSNELPGGSPAQLDGVNDPRFKEQAFARIGMRSTPLAVTQTTPQPFCMPGAEQVRKRVTLGGNGQPGFGTPDSQPFTLFLDTPQPTVAWRESNQQDTDPGPSASSNGAANGQPTRTTSVPKHDLVNGAKNAFQGSLRASLSHTNYLGADAFRDSIDYEFFIASIESAMFSAGIQGLAKRTVWLKLEDVVREHPKSAEAMISQRVTGLNLVYMSKDQMLFALGVHATQDPDRSNKKQNDTNSAADFAAMENVLRKRQEKPIKQEKRGSKTPRPSTSPGNSISDPFVIDD
ncbi:hypothetical protein N0V82_000269 [Gnomoniopsis sp. IMI 355080]|nr:hypothetical protein N0V82_000269 [Gnomoniopsis sp. IMI 355080]